MPFGSINLSPSSSFDSKSSCISAFLSASTEDIALPLLPLAPPNSLKVKYLGICIFATFKSSCLLLSISAFCCSVLGVAIVVEVCCADCCSKVANSASYLALICSCNTDKGTISVTVDNIPPTYLC